MIIHVGSKFACEEKQKSLEDEEEEMNDRETIIPEDTDKEYLPPCEYKQRSSEAIADNKPDKENLPPTTGNTVRKRKRKLLVFKFHLSTCMYMIV